MKVRSPQALEFACHQASCAPPPAGSGGSSPSGSGHVRLPEITSVGNGTLSGYVRGGRVYVGGRQVSFRIMKELDGNPRATRFERKNPWVTTVRSGGDLLTVRGRSEEDVAQKVLGMANAKLTTGEGSGTDISSLLSK